MKTVIHKFEDHKQIGLVSYSEETKELAIKFSNGKVYVYKNVPKEKYNELIEAPSAGSYLHRNIKGSHGFRSVDGKEALEYTMLEDDFIKLTINLCDSCTLDLALCPKDGKKFGNGVGNDNVYECINYSEDIQKSDNISSLARLEKVILDYYISKGYVVGSGGWCFEVAIASIYKNKSLVVKFFQLDDNKEWDENLAFSKLGVKTIEEAFTEAINFFEEDTDSKSYWEHQKNETKNALDTQKRAGEVFKNANKKTADQQ